MALRFRPGVNGVVLRSRDDFQILRIVTLQSFDECDTEPAGEVRIFAVGFLSASPARVAKDIDVWRPEGETVKPVRSYRAVVLRDTWRALLRR